MSARVAASTESDILESGAMRASVTAPTMAATIAMDRSARSRKGTVSKWLAISLDSRRKPAMTAQRVLLSLRASSLPRAAKGHPVLGWSR